MRKFSPKAFGFGLAIVTSWAVSANASITVVTSDNTDGWSFQKTSGDPNYTYGAGDATTGLVNGPATPPLGTGSANLNTGSDGSQSAQLRNSSWAGTAISDLTSLSYSTYATSWNGQQLPFLNLYLSNGDRLWFEPTYTGAVMLNTWQTWNTLAGMWYTDDHFGPSVDEVGTWAAVLAAEGPGVTIINPSSSLGGIRIASGFASQGDVFNTYVDNFTIGTSAGTTTYDFEASAVPEPTTVIAGALLLLPFGAGALRMLRKARTA